MDDTWPEWKARDPHGGGHESDDEEEEKKKKKAKHAKQELFCVDPIDLPFQGRVRQVAVGSETFAVIMDEGGGDRRHREWSLCIFTSDCDMMTPLTSKMVEARYDYTDASRVHIDPTGQHVLLSLENGDNYYANSKWDDKAKVRAVRCDQGGAMPRNVCVESVGWDKHNCKESSSGSIVLGDRRGLLHLCRLERKAACRHHRHAYDLSKEPLHGREREPIHAIHVEQFGTASQRLLVLVATPMRLYEFVGGPTLDDVFAAATRALPMGGHDHLVRQLLPPPGTVAGPPPDWGRAELALSRPLDGQSYNPRATPQALAWSAWLGVFHAKLDLCATAAPGTACVGAHAVIVFEAEGEASKRQRGLTGHSAGDGGPSIRPGRQPAGSVVGGGHLHAPPPCLGAAISEYHFYLLRAERLRILAQPPGLSWLSQEPPRDRLKPLDVDSRTVWQNLYGSNTRAVGMARDDGTGKLYVWTGSTRVDEICPVNQSTQVWRSFLQRASDQAEPDREEYFKTSLRLCPDPMSRDRVRAAAGDFYFECGDYAKAARVYSRTNRSFEETSLRLSQCGDDRALLTFLLCRLEHMKDRAVEPSQEESQYSLICTWAVQLFLDLLNTQQGSADALRSRFHDFIEKYGEHLSGGSTDARRYRPIKAATMELIRAHGRPEETLHYAALTRDYRRVVAHYVNHERYDLALQCLGTSCTRLEYEELWYQYSPQLIMHDPVQVVRKWMTPAVSRILKPAKLIPAILIYRTDMNPPGESKNQCVEYLRWLLGEQKEGSRDMGATLLTCLAQQKCAAGGGASEQSRARFDDAAPGMAVRLTPESQQCVPGRDVFSGVVARREGGRVVVRWDEPHLGGPPAAAGLGAEHAVRREWWEGAGAVAESQRPDEGPLLEYIMEECFEAVDTDEDAARPRRRVRPEQDICFDLKYALRLCVREGQRRGCVFIYSAMLLFDDAVDAALALPDVELAKEQVGYHLESLPDESEQRKRLWMKIARCVVTQPDMGVGAAIKMVKHCEDLSVEDILPLFPDSVVIQEFKDELRATLDKYDEDIEILMCQMEEKTEEQEELIADIKNEQQRSAFLPAGAPCGICGEPGLAADSFYLFHCGHAFHQQCVITYEHKWCPQRLARRLPKQQHKQAQRLQDELRDGRLLLNDEAATDYAAAEERRHRLGEQKRELDEIMGAECPFCGDAMAREVGLEFVSQDEPEAVSWQL